jgi:hypothetical protein
MRNGILVLLMCPFHLRDRLSVFTGIQSCIFFSLGAFATWANRDWTATWGEVCVVRT